MSYHEHFLIVMLGRMTILARVILTRDKNTTTIQSQILKIA